jgi:pilus assembly protein CpaF
MISAKPLFDQDPGLEAELRRIYGPVVVEYMSKDACQELSANWEALLGQCSLHADLGKGPMVALGHALPAVFVITGTRLLATRAGKALNPRAPFLNRVLACGFRYHAVLPPSSDGPSFSIRTHHRRDWQLAHFNMTQEQMRAIERAILEQQTILISGRTNSGKTSLLNALLALVPPHERLLVIEDEPELQIRPGRNVTRRRATEAADLKRHIIEALRDRPDRVICGEIRGPEAADVLEAAATGHSGASTIHAGSVDEALSRPQRLANCDRELVWTAVDMVIQVGRQPDGRRAITEIKELKAT